MCHNILGRIDSQFIFPRIPQYIPGPRRRFVVKLCLRDQGWKLCETAIRQHCTQHRPPTGRRRVLRHHGTHSFVYLLVRLLDLRLGPTAALRDFPMLTSSFLAAFLCALSVLIDSRWS